MSRSSQKYVHTSGCATGSSDGKFAQGLAVSLGNERERRRLLALFKLTENTPAGTIAMSLSTSPIAMANAVNKVTNSSGRCGKAGDFDCIF
jgi:hypothetical protein